MCYGPAVISKYLHFNTTFPLLVGLYRVTLLYFRHNCGYLCESLFLITGGHCHHVYDCNICECHYWDVVCSVIAVKFWRSGRRTKTRRPWTVPYNCQYAARAPSKYNALSVCLSICPSVPLSACILICRRRGAGWCSPSLSILALWKCIRVFS